MPQGTNLYCEVFLTGHKVTREELAQWLVTNVQCVASGMLLSKDGLELQVRNNPRLKKESPSELARLQSNDKSGFVFSDLTLEIEPANETMETGDFVAAVRPLLAQLKERGFEIHVASDLEDELID